MTFEILLQARWTLAAVVFLAFATPAEARVEVGDTAPAFSLRTTRGQLHNIEAYRGKVVILEFMTSWCNICARSVPDLNWLAKKYPGDLVVLAVSTAEDDPNGVDAFIEDTRPDFPILLDKTDRVGRAYGAFAFPSYFVIDRRGVVRAKQRGPVNWKSAKIIAILEGLLNPADELEASVSPGPVTRAALP